MDSIHDLPHSPASDRNRKPICQVLRRWLPDQARVLEIGSGSGQHAVYFCDRIPGLHWQATELAEHMAGLRLRLAVEGSQLPAPMELDVRQADWPEGPYDAIFTANTLHIMPWDHTPVLIRQSAKRLVPGGLLVIYGPFQYQGRHTADSNRQFDHSLTNRDPAMGVRDAVAVSRLAEMHGLIAEADIAMPANNRILIFRQPPTSNP